jgi:hypothetical protein
LTCQITHVHNYTPMHGEAIDARAVKDEVIRVAAQDLGYHLVMVYAQGSNWLPRAVECIKRVVHDAPSAVQPIFALV